MTEKKTEYGAFIPDCAGYRLNTFNLPTSWEYIYQNRDVLLKVDQFGPVYIQAKPPGDILLLRRENGQKYSNWAVWFRSDEFQQPFTNFFRPLCDNKHPELEPDNLQISFRPECAAYSFEWEGLRVQTEFFVPSQGSEVVMKLRIRNNRMKRLLLEVSPYLVPYNNQAQLAPWDKNEWYLKSGMGREKESIFWSQLLSNDGDPSRRRNVVLWTDRKNMRSEEISLEKWIGFGSLTGPEMPLTGKFEREQLSSHSFGEYGQDNVLYGYPPVYAQQYGWELAPGEEKELTQVLAMPEMGRDGWLPERETVLKPLGFFQKETYQHEKEQVGKKLREMCDRNRIHTGDAMFDYYMNYWLPLQMVWVASLDRGWPTGMRGSRDSAQDYAALLYTDTKSCKEVLKLMLSCQRSDGWFPRQYSAAGRKGTHDLRGHVDGGVFTIEFMWLYLAHTQDWAVLKERLPWLDHEEESSVMDHITRAMEFYLLPEQTGEHGLCKIGEGDWLDAVNRAGTEGRGESVMVSCQCVMSLRYLCDILRHEGGAGEQIARYEMEAEKHKQAVLKNAYNEAGFFSGVFNDTGHWIFSAKDPDGQRRPYGPVNWYAVISGVADQAYYPNVLQVMQELFGPCGVRLFHPPLGGKPMDHVGRVASGDVPPYLTENGNVYNHGSQGFLARALSVMGESQQLFEMLKWIAPYDQSKHPTETAMMPPYAIVNCWQELPIFQGRALMCFLTGSVAMLARGVYEWMFGVRPCLDGLGIRPCIPGNLENASIAFWYLERRVHLEIRHAKGNSPKSTCNGKEIRGRVRDLMNGEALLLLRREDLNEPCNEIICWINE